MNEIERELHKLNGNQEETYSKMVSSLIRKRYSLGEELALSRQRDEKPEEWEAFYRYCEACKKEARQIIYND